MVWEVDQELTLDPPQATIQSDKTVVLLEAVATTPRREQSLQLIRADHPANIEPEKIEFLNLQHARSSHLTLRFFSLSSQTMIERVSGAFLVPRMFRYCEDCFLLEITEIPHMPLVCAFEAHIELKCFIKLLIVDDSVASLFFGSCRGGAVPGVGEFVRVHRFCLSLMPEY